MKKYVIALAGLAAAALVSCTREINPASPLDGTLRFTVRLPPSRFLSFCAPIDRHLTDRTYIDWDQRA